MALGIMSDDQCQAKVHIPPSMGAGYVFCQLPKGHADEDLRPAEPIPHRFAVEWSR